MCVQTLKPDSSVSQRFLLLMSHVFRTTTWFCALIKVSQWTARCSLKLVIAWRVVAEQFAIHEQQPALFLPSR